MAIDLEEKQAAIEDIVSEISRMRTVVSEAVEEGVQSALKAVKQGRAATEDTIHDARHAIRRNPLQAMGIVFAAGVAIGTLITLISVSRD